MKHPRGNCQNCGERLFTHAEGGYKCYNCDTQHPTAGFETADAEC